MRKLIAGNWKMNGSLASLGEAGAIAIASAMHPDVDVAIALPATLLYAAKQQRLSGPRGTLAFGAQDVHHAASGAHTGCLSAAMLREAGASFTIVGHSERRADQHETNADVRAKAMAAHLEGLSVILCVGETEAQRDAGTAAAVVEAQIVESLPDKADSSWLTLSYEPRWAIGTGRTPTMEEIAEIHAHARATLIKAIGDNGASVRILYGGSVTGENAQSILAVPGVDGALVGGASLTAAKFMPIVEAAARGADRPL